MRIDQSSIDISSLVDKVRRGELDLQPDFQRGTVWADAKKRRLVDTILREWYVPAIHVVVNDELDIEEVLDGQQRLRAIVSFMDDEFSVDGKIEPEDSDIRDLHGLRYSQLPDRIKSRFKRFTIVTARLRDYSPDEPGELFFRLNQITALTAAEQRNALVGRPRNQIRELVEKFEKDLSGAELGFSNSRMNLDDTISRLAVTLEAGRLSEKVTATTLERRYRNETPFPPHVIGHIEQACSQMAVYLQFTSIPVKLNKASLFSWLYFFVDYDFDSLDWRDSAGAYFANFESFRAGHSRATTDRLDRQIALDNTISIFNDRASSRVNDTSSLLLRDLCLSVGLAMIAPETQLLSPELERRSALLEELVRRLQFLPSDIAERSVVESSLVRQWEARRALG